MLKKYFLFITITLLFYLKQGNAQDKRTLQFFRSPGFKGLNVFETKKDTAGIPFSGVKVKVGGDFALQFQGLDHSTKSGDTLATLGNNFNLPTSNLNLDVQLADGLRMSLVTYLSSRNHNDAWVKGGYLQIDKLDFIKKDLLKGLMRVLTLKAGLDEINYGDAHFRRSDNARAIYNPFVGNYIMDAFTTEVFGELNIQKSNFLLVAGLSNGNLNQTVVSGTKEPKPSGYGKLGYDKQVGKDLRVRLTGSFYLSPGYDNGQYLYSGDRAGSRYYNVMQKNNAAADFRSGGFTPGFWKYQAYQVNLFSKYKGLELFGLYEIVNGDKSRTQTGGTYSQVGAELIYRLGAKEQFYLGSRYNLVTGKDTSNAFTKSIDRINFGAGWFLTNEVLIKAEYITQNYSGDAWLGTVYQRGNFKGVMLEAVIGF